VKITRKDNDLLEKVGEHERSSIKIGAKLFLNNHSAKNLTTAIDNLFKTLNIDYLDNLILAYHPKAEVGSPAVQNGTDIKEGVIEWGTGQENALNNLKNLWQLLVEYATNKKVRVILFFNENLR
jgi:glutamate--cysteine ligase regulatory subunit